MTAGALVVYAVAAAAVVTAVGVVGARNAVHAVLLMVVNFVLTAVLYLSLHAPFIAMAQVTVYAGAIMVLFLFVVMLLGHQEIGFAEPLLPQRLLGVPLLAALGVLLVAVVAGAVPGSVAGDAAAATLGPDFGSPATIGEALVRRHVLAFEIVGVLLLVAMLGAVTIGRFRPTDEPAARTPRERG